MGTNHLKFVSIPDAIEEVKTTLLMQSEFKKREELEPILRQLEDMQIRKDTKKVHPLDFAFISKKSIKISCPKSLRYHFSPLSGLNCG
jgi:hypothetical protein